MKIKFFNSLESLTSNKSTHVKRKIKINGSFNRLPGVQWTGPVVQKESGDVWKIGYDWQYPSIVKLKLIERGNGSSHKIKSNIRISPPCLVNDCYYSDRMDTKIKPGKEAACTINPPSCKANLMIVSVSITYVDSLYDSSDAILIDKNNEKKIWKSKNFL